MDLERQILIDRLLTTLNQYASVAHKESLRVLYVELAATFARSLDEDDLRKWIDAAEKDLVKL